MASFIQLKELFNDLFTKVKARDIVSGEVNADNSNKKLILKRKDNSSQIDIDFNNVALLDKENNFTQNNKFEDIMMDNGVNRVSLFKGDTTQSQYGGQRYAADRALTTSKFKDGYIDFIRLHLASDITTNTVTDLHIWIVEKKENKNVDVVLEKIPSIGGDGQGQNFTVQLDGENKYIDIPIKRSFDKEVYFIPGGYSDSNASNGRRFKAINIDSNNTDDIANIVNSNQRPILNQAPRHDDGANYCPYMELFGRFSVKDMYNQNNKSMSNIQQSINNKIDASEIGTYGNKIPRLSNGKLPVSVLPSVNIGADTENTFTNINTFINHSPIVNRLFTRKHINSNVASSNIASYPANKYFAAINDIYTDNNKQISHLLLPIRGVNVGQNVTIYVFAFNGNKKLIREFAAKQYTVVNEEIAGCKCVKIDISINSNEGVNGIGFGFMINTDGVTGVCMQQGSSNLAWTNTSKPNESTTFNPTDNMMFPYKICYETTSELVTRFELENVTQMYPRLIGEYRSLAYEAGNKLEEEGHIWLRVNGQAISKTEYPALFDKMNTSRNDDLEELQLPQVDDRVGYCYICAK